MTDPERPYSPQPVTVFGGSGFLGRYVVDALAERNYRVRVAVRRPNLVGYPQTYGMVGQVQAVQANLRYRQSIEHAVRGASAVINLVGILHPGSRQTFEAVHVDGARAVAEAAAAAGARMIHVSAIGADPNSDSAYARTKAEGEAAVLAAHPNAIVMRPSLMFGPGDGLFNRFAALAQFLPVLPLAGAESRFQPVFAGDVAKAIAQAVDGNVAGGRIYELGGPEVKSLRDLVTYMLAVIRRRRLVVGLPPGMARAQAALTEVAHLLSLGLLPDTLRLSRDQVALLQHDNVVSDAARREGRTLEGLGIVPTTIEAIVPAYLVRFRKKGQFEVGRNAGLGAPNLDQRAPGPTSSRAGEPGPP
ncbi:MAG TPA: complex I NDUFA9 subunit family protein [Beijerinckiaceae bacterium]|nr:complex I NDUFA9 subunit family protein [Beijerinckiaceae bacterium]